MGQLDGKVAIVTGGAKGLGKAICEAYAAEGAKVVVTDIDTAGAEAVASAVGGSAQTVDAGDEGQVSALVDAVVAEHGGLDIMVANAGVAMVKPIAMMSLADWRQVTSINLDGVFLANRYAAPAMAASGGGTIVNMASITGTAGSPLISSYAAAKAGVISITQTMAVEWRDHGVRTNCLAPGFITTDMVEDNKSSFGEFIDLPMPFDDIIAGKQGRYGEASEVARMAVFLAGPRSSFTNGSTFVIDGGAKASLL